MQGVEKDMSDKDEDIRIFRLIQGFVASLTIIIMTCGCTGNSAYPTTIDDIETVVLQSPTPYNVIPTEQEETDILTTSTPILTTPATYDLLSNGTLLPGLYLIYSEIDVDESGNPIITTYASLADGDLVTILYDGILEDAVLSPNGNQIAFVQPQSLYILNLVDNSVESIPDTDDCKAPDWSPDGSMLAFDCFRNDGYDVFIALVTEWNRYRLQRKYPLIQSTGPIWSSNGKWIAYFAGELRSGVVSEYNGIYVTSADSILEGKIPDDDNTIGPIYQTSTYAWTTSGESLAYLSQPDEISIFNVNTQHSEVFIKLDEEISDFMWSPDGNWIALVTSSGIYRIQSIGGGDPLAVKTGKEDMIYILNFWTIVE